MNGWMNVCMYVWRGGWMIGWMDRCIDGWMDDGLIDVAR